MSRLAQRAAFLTAIGLLTAAAAMAGVPNAGQSNLNNGCSFGAGCLQEGILLLGGQNSGGTVDVNSEKQVLVKDAGGNTVANSTVIINFSTCYSGDAVRISSTQLFAGLTVNCGAHTVSATTNGSGIAVFRVEGYSNVPGGVPPGSTEGCATVTADGVPLGSYSVGTADLNGGLGGSSLGVTGGDTTLYNLMRFGGAPNYRPRGNFARDPGFPASQVINGGDTTIYNKFRYLGGSTTNGATACP